MNIATLFSDPFTLQLSLVAILVGMSFGSGYVVGRAARPDKPKRDEKGRFSRRRRSF